MDEMISLRSLASSIRDMRPASSVSEQGGLWNGVKKWTGNAALAGSILAGSEVPALAQPNEPEKREEKSLSLEEVEALRAKFSSGVFRIRQPAMKELEDRTNHLDTLIYLAPTTDDSRFPDAEGNRRAEAIIESKRDDLIAKHYRVELSAPGWVDGLNFNTGLKNDITLSPTLGGGTLRSRAVIDHYLPMAQQSGAKSDGSPKWTDYEVGLNLLLDDMWRKGGKTVMWNAKAKKEYGDVLRKNPKLDRADWLKKRFHRDMAEVMKEIHIVGEEFVTGSEEYRKNNKLPLLRPEIGPILRFAPQRTPREQMRDLVAPFLTAP